MASSSSEPSSNHLTNTLLPAKMAGWWFPPLALPSSPPKRGRCQAVPAAPGALGFSLQEQQLLGSSANTPATGILSRCFLPQLWIFTALDSPWLVLAAIPFKLWFGLQMCLSFAEEGACISVFLSPSFWELSDMK